MTEINYEEANKISARVNRMGCNEPLSTPLKMHSTKKPEPFVAATVLCRVKLRMGDSSDRFCSAIDGSQCPKALSVVELQKLVK